MTDTTSGEMYEVSGFEFLYGLFGVVATLAAVLLAVYLVMWAYVLIREALYDAEYQRWRDSAEGEL